MPPPHAAKKPGSYQRKPQTAISNNNNQHLTIPPNGVWGLRPQRVQGRARPPEAKTNQKNIMAKGLQNRASNDPRAASLLALGRVIGGQADSQAALDKQLEASQLVPTDKGLCTELFYGVLRCHLRLEWFLRQKLAKPDNLPVEMRLALEQGLYEIMHTRIPEHAAVNWVVNLVSNRFGQGLGKVANGVLRGAIRGRKAEYENKAFYAGVTGRAADSAEVLGLLHAMPDWIVEMWLKAYGPASTQAFLKAGLRAAPQALRVNLSKAEKEEVTQELQAQNARLLQPACWVLEPGSRLPMRDWHKRGLASRQSGAAYEALFSLRPAEWGGPLWDACAGRGNKTLALLESGIAVHTVGDPNTKRLQGLQSELERLGLPPQPVIEHGCDGNECTIDFAKLAAAKKAALPKPEVFAGSAAEAGFENMFGTVLVDAPCSGLGTLSHRPEIRWRRTRADVEKLCAVQGDILAAAHKALIKTPGSRIIYMTCTLNPAENREQAEKFLTAHPEYKLAREFQTPPDSVLSEFFYAAELVMEGQ